MKKFGKRLLIGIILVGILAAYPVIFYTSSEIVEITVNDKESVTKKDDSKYLIHTDGETFENTDETWYWKYNSSDVQGELRKDSTYNVKVVGWRWPFFSMHRNIIEIVD